MTARDPLVMVAGAIRKLPDGDTINGASGDGGSTHTSGTLANRPASPTAGDTYAVSSGEGVGDVYLCAVTNSWVLIRPSRRAANGLHRWTLDEGTGTSFSDTGSGNNALTLTGAATVTAMGLVGKGIRFSGANGVYANTIDSPAVPAAGAWSVKLSVKFSSTGGNQYLLTKLHATSTWSAPYAAVAVYLNTNFGVGSNAGGSWAEYNTSYAPIVGTWYRIAITYDGTNIRFYLDGVLLNTWGIAGTVTWGDGAWSVGANNPASAITIGTLDEVEVIDGVLTADQVSDDAARQFNNFT